MAQTDPLTEFNAFNEALAAANLCAQIDHTQRPRPTGRPGSAACSSSSAGSRSSSRPEALPSRAAPHSARSSIAAAEPTNFGFAGRR